MKDSHPAWSSQHDLALLYLALLHGAEAGPDEDVVRERLMRRYPKAGAVRLNRVLDRAMLVYIGTAGEQMLEVAVAALGQALPRAARRAVLDDLARIASTSEGVVPAGLAFIEELAREWGLDGQDWTEAA